MHGELACHLASARLISLISSLNSYCSIEYQFDKFDKLDKLDKSSIFVIEVASFEGLSRISLVWFGFCITKFNTNSAKSLMDVYGVWTY